MDVNRWLISPYCSSYIHPQSKPAAVAGIAHGRSIVARKKPTRENRILSSMAMMNPSINSPITMPNVQYAVLEKARQKTLSVNNWV